MSRYFGTDGFRGEANVDLTAWHAYNVGSFLGHYYRRENHKPRIVIGKDTRRSSYMLEYAIASGITASGADAYMLHVTTTPSVSYVAKQDNFDCGIMITASHNPYYDNGIKIVNNYGEKISDDVIEEIESYLDGNTDLTLAKREEIGAIIDYAAGRNRYIGYLISLASHSYRKFRIGLDCANGASWSIAKAVFDALGAQTYVIGASPDGTNINYKCGSTHIDALSHLVKKQHLDIGFGFDGDADRCIAVDEKGEIIDGDKILYILAQRFKNRGMLRNNTVVATIMSNLGLINSLKEFEISTVTTGVGDRFVYQEMSENDYLLGGEQSGHIIIRKYATTGDALLTAIMLTEELADKKEKASQLASGLTLYPQVTKNLKVSDKISVCNDSEILERISQLDAELNGNGRIVLRASGTEPAIRIMVEADSTERCEHIINSVIELISEKGYAE